MTFNEAVDCLLEYSKRHEHDKHYAVRVNRNYDYNYIFCLGPNPSNPLREFGTGEYFKLSASDLQANWKTEI